LGVWHRRAGKDDVMLHRAAVAAFERPATYWHALPEYSQARKAIWNAVNSHTGKRRIDEAFPHELRENTNDNEMFIRFKNGATWQVIGSDRYNSLVGAGVAGVSFSEWALCNPSSWGYIRPMMEENNGWAAFITTPRGRNHAHDMLTMARDNPRWFAEVLNIHQTGALSPEQIAESLDEYVALYGEDIGRAQFQQEYECSFNAAILGAFYAREMIAVQAEGRIEDDLQPVDAPVHRAWDLGVRDDTSIWFWQVVGGQIFVVDCYSASGVGLDHYASVIEAKYEERGWRHGVDYVPHDAKVREWTNSGPDGKAKTRIETLLELGRKPRLVPAHKLDDGINAARRTLARCIFDEDKCADGIEALRQYRREWDEDERVFRDTPKHDWSSHTADAFRYLAMAWQTLAPDRPKPSPIVSIKRPTLDDLWKQARR